ncbi:MAG: hypothetical protein HY092_03350 [Candidatus Kerfeldbacteria bacterium]|nr:hypothetical protein [Candidatus Kerfeldbacteria bacterium]
MIYTLILKALPIILPTVISTGIVSVFISHYYDKKIKTHEIKLAKYISLVEELAKMVGNMPDFSRLIPLLNEALLFGSDGVVREILNFNKAFTQKQSSSAGDFYIDFSQTLKPLIIEIRKDLYLKSTSIEDLGLVFFQKPDGGGQGHS